MSKARLVFRYEISDLLYRTLNIIHVPKICTHTHNVYDITLHNIEYSIHCIPLSLANTCVAICLDICVPFEAVSTWSANSVTWLWLSNMWWTWLFINAWNRYRLISREIFLWCLWLTHIITGNSSSVLGTILWNYCYDPGVDSCDDARLDQIASMTQDQSAPTQYRVPTLDHREGFSLTQTVQCQALESLICSSWRHFWSAYPCSDSHLHWWSRQIRRIMCVMDASWRVQLVHSGGTTKSTPINE